MAGLGPLVRPWIRSSLIEGPGRPTSYMRRRALVEKKQRSKQASKHALDAVIQDAITPYRGPPTRDPGRLRRSYAVRLKVSARARPGRAVCRIIRVPPSSPRDEGSPGRACVWSPASCVLSDEQSAPRKPGLERPPLGKGASPRRANGIIRGRCLSPSASVSAPPRSGEQGFRLGFPRQYRCLLPCVSVFQMALWLVGGGRCFAVLCFALLLLGEHP